MLRSSPLFQLYLTRLRDFYRQPARIFWVYGFPTLLAVVLGWAFQSRPPAPILVDLVRDPASSGIKSALQAHNAAIERELAVGKARTDVPPVMIHEEDQAKSLKRLNTGKAALVIEPLGSDSWVYRYDPTRPEAVAARQTIDDILQRSAGRKDPMATKDVVRHRARLTLHRLLHPGVDRAQRHGGRALGNRLPAGQLPGRQVAQAVRGHAHAPTRLPPGHPGCPVDFPPPGPDRTPPGRDLDVPHADPRQPGRGHPGRRDGGPGVFRDWPARGLPGDVRPRRSRGS